MLRGRIYNLSELLGPQIFDTKFDLPDLPPRHLPFCPVPADRQNCPKKVLPPALWVVLLRTERARSLSGLELQSNLIGKLKPAWAWQVQVQLKLSVSWSSLFEIRIAIVVNTNSNIHTCVPPKSYPYYNNTGLIFHREKVQNMKQSCAIQIR